MLSFPRGGGRVWHDALMGISQKLLSDGEHVVLSVRTHAKALIAPVALLILVVAGVLTAAMLQPDNSVWGLAAAVVAVPVLIIWSFIPFLRWTTSTYTVTNRRLITRSGIITRTGRDIPLFRINDVAYEKGLLDRILGCGTLIISDATEKAGVVLPDVPQRRAGASADLGSALRQRRRHGRRRQSSAGGATAQQPALARPYAAAPLYLRWPVCFLASPMFVGALPCDTIAGARARNGDGNPRRVADQTSWAIEA